MMRQQKTLQNLITRKMAGKKKRTHLHVGHDHFISVGEKPGAVADQEHKDDVQGNFGQDHLSAPLRHDIVVLGRYYDDPSSIGGAGQPRGHLYRLKLLLETLAAVPEVPAGLQEFPAVTVAAAAIAFTAQGTGIHGRGICSTNVLVIVLIIMLLGFSDPDVFPEALGPLVGKARAVAADEARDRGLVGN